MLTAWLRENRERPVGLKQIERCLEDLVREGLVLDPARVQELTRTGLFSKSAMERLNDLEGLAQIKTHIARNIDLFQEARDQRRTESPKEDAGLGTNIGRLTPLPKNQPEWGMRHLALVGNPGTGKTTVARLIGEIYRDAGILELGHTIKCTRKDLVGGYVGQTAIQTGEKIDAAMGGVLFVDEAYSLVQGGENDFGREAITEILEAMSARKGRFLVILAGYPNEIQQLIDSNPGFQRRVQTIELEDYPPDALERIFRKFCRNSTPQLDLEPELDAALPLFFQELCSRKEENFGNAGTVQDEIFQAVLEASDRTGDGRRMAGKRHFPPKYQECFQARSGGHLETLQSLIGLAGVKTRVQELIDLKNLEARRAMQSSTPQNMPESGHYLFVGNPGTGKTTVARMMGEQFRQIGILKRGHLVSVTASELSGQYLGHTEAKTREILEKSLGGVCFVDEAHQLGMEHGYGQQALGVIVPFMTDHKSEFSLIFAGYPGPIQNLLNLDSGLKRRFTEPIDFEDYSAPELVEIFYKMATDAGLNIDRDADIRLKALMDDVARNKTGSFGNAGMVENLLKHIRLRQAGRLRNAPDDADLNRVIGADIPDRGDIGHLL